jgi:ureidoacrylate peracid hydrolase
VFWTSIGRWDVPRPSRWLRSRRWILDDAHSPLAAVVDPQHTAVLVVDVEPLFVNMTLVPPVDQVLLRLRRLLDAAQAAGVLRIFIRSVIPEERWTAPWRQQFSPDMQAANAPGSPLNAFHPDFEPQPGDLSLVKDRFSAFMATELAALPQERGIRTVIVARLITDVCVSSTAGNAFQLDFLTVTLADCTATATLAQHEASLTTIADAFGQVCLADDVMGAWQTHAVPAASRG